MLVAGGSWLAYRVLSGAVPAPWAADGVWLWVAATMTLGIFSFLLGDNPFYKFTESLFIGVSAAYWMVVGFWTTLVPNLFGKIFPGFVADHLLPGLRENGVLPEPDLSFLIPLVFGIMLLWRLAPKGGWISRWALGVVVGTTVGLRLIGFLVSDFIGQIRNGIKPLVTTLPEGGIDWGTSIAAIVSTIGIISGLVYFYFSKEHKGLFGKVSRVGIWGLMITFGAGFGYTVMGRIALLVGRFEFLLYDWLRLKGH